MPPDLGVQRELGRVAGVLEQLVQEVRANDGKTDSLSSQVAELRRDVKTLFNQFQQHMASHAVMQAHRWDRVNVSITAFATVTASIVGGIIVYFLKP